MSSRYDVVVIGGGHNGLTAAALVAQRGRKTLLVERRELLGGLAAGEEFHPGFSDSGVWHETAHVRPSVVRALGLEKLGLVMGATDAPALAVEERGPGLLLSSDREVMRAELERRAAGDGDRYIGFREFVKRVTPAIRRLMSEPPPDIFEPGVRDLCSLGLSAVALRLLGKTTMMELLRVAPTPVADFIDEWFDDELTKAALAAPAVWSTWTGPRSPGTTLNLLLAEATRARPVVGGPRALIEALEKAARDRGVEIRTDAPVEEVEVTDGVVRGVRLMGGETIRCRSVAASCDPKQLFSSLLRPEVLSRQLAADIGNLRVRGTTAKVDLALSRYPVFNCRPDLPIGSIRTGESLDHLERAFDPVKYRRLPRRPVLDIRIPTIDSPDLAPDGKHVASILAHFVPYDLDGGWSDDRREELLEAVVAEVERYAPEVRGLVEGHRLLSPVDLEARFGVTGGQLHHGEHAIDQLLVRPAPGCARHTTPIEGLFLCGSGSHPGGGVTCAPGALGARAVLTG